MIIKASGRSALILATGLLVCFAAGPSQAAPASADNAAANAKAEANAKTENAAGAPVALNKYTKHAAHRGKSYPHRAPSNVAEKSPTARINADAAADDGDNSSASAIPPSVANANAELASADNATGSAARAMSVRANEIVQNAPDNPANAQPAALTQIVTADQLNEVDRALQESASPAPTLAVASAEPPAAPAAPVAAASSSESSTWDQTSLIGKIFIGFGALLTMASAARMFMA
jgi:hypothetical protein